jgi:squalene cyclase
MILGNCLEKWRNLLRYDPLSNLRSSENPAILFFTKNDLQNENVNQIETLWEQPSVKKIVSNQQPDGSWRYLGAKLNIRSQQNYNQIETYRILGELVEKYGLTNRNNTIRKAADFLFSFQTQEGDFRGIYGNQYSPNYTAAIMELLIKSGYQNDLHIEKGFRWLLSARQNDGGWAIASRTRNAKVNDFLFQAETIQPDRTKPFSHLVTGVVLRAFAAHPKYGQLDEAKVAGKLLASRFFKKDAYPDRGTVAFWTEFSFPFWFTDILSSLDSLSLLGFKMQEPQIKVAINWLINAQLENGLWNVHLVRGKDKNLHLWIALAICRVLKRFCLN